MLKQKRQILELLFIISDLIMVSISWILAYWLRFTTDIIPALKGIPSADNYWRMFIFIWVIWYWCYRSNGLYKPMRTAKKGYEVLLLVRANVLACLILITATYLFWEKSAPFSRLVFVYFGVISTTLSIIQRLTLRYILKDLRRKGYNLRYLLIVGASQIAGDIASRVRLQRELGIQLVGCLAKDATQKKGPKGIPIIGQYSDIGKVVKIMDIDQVMIALPLEDGHMLPEIMAGLSNSIVDIKIVPDLYQFVGIGGALEEFDGLPVISVQSSPIDGINYFVKRAFDIVISVSSLIILSPLLIAIALVVKLSSPKGGIFYIQERMSVDGSKFKILKFRSMPLDAEKDGPQWSKKNDDRIPAWGRFLRKYSLDELPQLINVLVGDMSIVGPRPERPIFIEDFSKRIPKYMLRHKVPAGMTGWAQVNGWRGDTSINKRIEYDLYYLKNWSIWLDLKIMFMTIFKGIKDNNA